MRILFSTCSAAHYMAPPRLADEQINCGPFFSDRQLGGRYVSLRTPQGEYDLFAVAKRLPDDQQPDAVVCLVDSAWFNLPANLAAFSCPKVLLVADTHHMTKPVLGMINYLTVQRFDRVVFLYTRHHLGLFRSAGVNQLYWFPCLTFPHGDAPIAAARRAERAPRLALVGQVANLHQRRLRLAGALAAQGLPVELRAISQREGLDFYGSSLIGFNASANADLNLRVFEVMASGAMLLTDRLAPESGMPGLWRDGRDLVTYGGTDELIERARHYLAHPEEARAIGSAGARWFTEHFNEARRQDAFRRLVFDGKALPEFAVPEPAKARVSFAGDSRRFISSIVVYERLQKVHSLKETVRVRLEAGVPADFERMCATLPRIRVERAGSGPAAAGEIDLLVLSSGAALATEWPAATRLWCWDAKEGDLAKLRARFAPLGLTMPNPDIGYFQRASAEAVPEADARSANARILFTTCDARGALAQARQALAEDPSAVEAHLVIAELALETGNLNLAAKMLAKARALDPAEPRVHLLALPSSVAAARGGLAGRLLAMGWRVFDIRDFHQAAVFARMAREADASLAEAAFLHGLASLEIAAADRNEPVAAWRAQGAGLRSLRAAVALAPERGDFALELALHLRIAGLLSEAVATYRAALQRDPADALAGFALGEALLALESPDEAASALEAASARAPGNARLQHWLGHARKRQGRLPEAFTLHRQASGGCEAIRPRAGRRRVVFAVQHGPSWPCLATVHAAFAADPAWEAVVVALPYLHPSFTKTTDRRNEIFEFLGRKGIVYVRWDRFVLEADGADVIFLQNPDDSTRPPGWCTGDLLKTGARLAYVPDAIEFGGTVEDATHQFNLPLQQVAWAVFARSEAHRQMFARHCVAGDAHVAATGHPKFDPPLETETADPELVTWAAGRPIVLWSPHFDVRFDGTRFGDGYSTFLRWWDFLGEEFARRPHQAFVIRPHPLFFSTLEDRGILTAEQVATFRTGCAQTENVRLDQRGAYLPVLAAASALLSDASSLVFEFGCTGKPVCLLHNPHGPLTRLYYELDLDWVREHCAWATTEAEIRGFLDGVAAGAMGDPARRAADGRRRMGVRLDGIGAAIKRTVDERLAAEIQALPACPPSAQRIAV